MSPQSPKIRTRGAVDARRPWMSVAMTVIVAVEGRIAWVVQVD